MPPSVYWNEILKTKICLVRVEKGLDDTQATCFEHCGELRSKLIKDASGKLVRTLKQDWPNQSDEFSRGQLNQLETDPRFTKDIPYAV